jgi:hypothetical protein
MARVWRDDVNDKNRRRRHRSSDIELMLRLFVDFLFDNQKL